VACPPSPLCTIDDIRAVRDDGHRHNAIVGARFVTPAVHHKERRTMVPITSTTTAKGGGRRPDVAASSV